jgi:hypothetical protein
MAIEASRVPALARPRREAHDPGDDRSRDGRIPESGRGHHEKLDL